MQTTTPKRTNAFSRCNTLDELNSHFEVLMSPESLWADGERSATQARAFARRFRREYKLRAQELKAL